MFILALVVERMSQRMLYAPVPVVIRKGSAPVLDWMRDKFGVNRLRESFIGAYCLMDKELAQLEEWAVDLINNYEKELLITDPTFCNISESKFLW